MENKTFGIITFAVLIEGIITYLNQFFVKEGFCWHMLLSLCFGIIVAIAYKLDLPGYLNIKSDIPYIGCILTGILISRGSNYAYDLLKAISKIE